VAGRDDRDPTTATRSVPDYTKALAGSIEGWKIGVPRNPIFAEVDGGVQRALDASLRELEALGAVVVPIELPEPRVLYALTNLVNKAEAAALHARWVRERRDDYSLSSVNRFEAGFHLPATYYLDALRVRGRLLADFVQRVFSRVDVVHLPVLGVPVPTIDDTEVRETAGVPELIERITRHTRWVNYVGIPGLSVPCGFDPDGLPVAFQLLGRPFGEARLLRMAHVYQQATDWHRRSPLNETAVGAPPC